MGHASPVFAADMVTKAPVAAPVQWWYEGFAEIGGRFYLNNPDRRELGKFYEYRDLRPGVFGNFFVGAHRNGPDPLDIEAWGKNIGWNDQAFGLDIAKPGSYYLTFGWDETPHVWSQKAMTMYNGVGTNNLTIPVFLTPPPATGAAAIPGLSHEIDLKIRRDTASASGRWTPTDNWDFNADYSHMHREGVQAGGAVSFSGNTGTSGSGTSLVTGLATRSTFEIPKPVDDVTQNAKLKGEYSGSTPWGKPFNVAVAGGLSTYRNAYDRVLFDNPWNSADTPIAPLHNMYSLPPDNQAGSVSVQGGVGLPFNSRYMGTFQYTRMTADQSSLPWTVNTAFPLASIPAFSAPSRETGTILFNNVLNTRITDNLTSTLKYRYYDYNAMGDPAVIFGPWPRDPDANSSSTTPNGTRYPSDYTKQNADAQLVWKATRWLNVGASYDWEGWHRSNRAVDTTNENSGKVFVDSRWGFSMLRASLLYGQRRYDSYNDAMGNSTANNAAFRMKDLANRDRTKGQISWAVDVTNSLTITPSGGFLYDDFQTDLCFTAPGCQFGMTKAKSWNGGADATLNLNRSLVLLVSYNYERGYRQVYERTSTPQLNMETTDQNHTVIVGGKYTVIPGKLFIDANYAHTFSVSQWTSSCTPAGCMALTGSPPWPIFPDTHNTNDRVDVQAKYVFDDTTTRGWGLFPKSQAYLKARVLWERNSNDAWQPLQVQSGNLINPGNGTTAYSIWMATGNPNYDVVLGQIAFGVRW